MPVPVSRRDMPLLKHYSGPSVLPGQGLSILPNSGREPSNARDSRPSPAQLRWLAELPTDASSRPKGLLWGCPEQLSTPVFPPSRDKHQALQRREGLSGLSHPPPPAIYLKTVSLSVLIPQQTGTVGFIPLGGGGEAGLPREYWEAPWEAFERWGGREGGAHKVVYKSSLLGCR